MALETGVWIEPIREIEAKDLKNFYVAIGTPIDHPAVSFLVQNLTDDDVYISIDGTNDHLYLPASGLLLYDISSNKNIGGSLLLEEGTTFSVKYAVALPTVGSVYLSIFYLY